MARGAAAKERRKNEKKEARATEAARAKEEKENNEGLVENEFDSPFPMPPSYGTSTSAENEDNNDDSSTTSEEPEEKKVKKKKKKALKAAMAKPPAPKKKEIKTLPLVLLVLLTGSTVLPALIYCGDYLGNAIQKNNIMVCLLFIAS